MGKVLILTSIKPDPYNGGGHPSGLIWEVMTYLRKKILTTIYLLFPMNLLSS